MRTIRLLSAIAMAAAVLSFGAPAEAQNGRLDDAKLKEAVPADVLTKLEGKVTVKPPAK